MFKAKSIALAMVSVLLLSGCGETVNTSEVMIYKSKKTQGTGAAATGYSTVKVEKGTYKDECDIIGSLYYTDDKDVIISEQNVELDKICVKNGQHVRKGDTLAIYHCTTSKSQIKKKKVELDQAKAQYQAQIKSKKNEIMQKRKSIKSQTDKYQKAIARVELKKLQKEYKQIQTGNSMYKDLQKTYNSLISKRSKTKLKSKYTGYVTGVISIDDFDSSANSLDASMSGGGSAIMKIRDRSKFLINVKTSKLRYNMTVDIGLGSSPKAIKHHLKGKVISTNNLSNDEEDMGEGEFGGEVAVDSSLIKVSKADIKKYNFRKSNIYINAVLLSINDALMVDSRAVYEDVEGKETKLYVWLVENKKLHKRYIVSNYKQDKCYLVSQGVEEGQTLAVLDE